MEYCSACGSRVSKRIPEGDDRPRYVCDGCDTIHYQNPRLIVGVIPVQGEQILLCRRAIEPRKGFWTFPAGYLELNETTAEGASREAWEEARARIEITGLVGIYEIPRISQVYVIHAGRMTTADHAPGPESTETMLVAWDEIPWPDIAFPSIRWSLEHYRSGRPPAVEQAPEGGY